MKKSIAKLALIGALVTSTLTVFGSPAHAEDQIWQTSGNGFTGTRCAGKYWDGFNIKVDDKVVAGVFIYYSPANGGTLCTFTRNYVHTGRNRQPWMAAMINDYYSNEAFNGGYFSSYAGTVSIRNVDGKCVFIAGTWAGKNARRYTDGCGPLVIGWHHN